MMDWEDFLDRDPSEFGDINKMTTPTDELTSMMTKMKETADICMKGGTDGIPSVLHVRTTKAGSGRSDDRKDHIFDLSGKPLAAGITAAAQKLFNEDHIPLAVSLIAETYMTQLDPDVAQAHMEAGTKPQLTDDERGEGLLVVGRTLYPNVGMIDALQFTRNDDGELVPQIWNGITRQDKVPYIDVLFYLFAMHCMKKMKSDAEFYKRMHEDMEWKDGP